MAFQNLRTGSTIYAFYKGDNPRVEIGQLMSDPEVYDKYPLNQAGQMSYQQPFMPQPQPQEKAVKLTVRFGEKIQPIERLTPTADIQDCGNGMMLSCSKDAINAEVLAYKQISDNAISENVISMHKVRSKACEDIIASLNPEIQERQRLEDENRRLRDELSSIKAETSDMKSMLGELLAQIGSQKQVFKPKNQQHGNSDKN